MPAIFPNIDTSRLLYNERLLTVRADCCRGRKRRNPDTDICTSFPEYLYNASPFRTPLSVYHTNAETVIFVCLLLLRYFDCYWQYA